MAKRLKKNSFYKLMKKNLLLVMFLNWNNQSLVNLLILEFTKGNLKKEIMFGMISLEKSLKLAEWLKCMQIIWNKSQK